MFRDHLMILDFEMFELDDLETCFSEVQHLFRIMLKKKLFR